MGASATTSPIDARGAARHGGFYRRHLGWIGCACAAAIALLGVAYGLPALTVAGVVGASALACVLAPELLLALYIVAGGIKAAPWLHDSVGDLTLIAAAGLLLALLITLVRKREAIVAPPPAMLLAVGLAALVVASVLWAPDPNAALRKALRFETLTLLAFVAPLLLVRSERALRWLMLALVGFGLLLALTAHPTKEVSNPLVIAGGTEIELGLYSAAGLIAAVGYLFVAGPSRWKFLWLVPAGFLAVTTLSSGSRGGLAGSAIGLIFVLTRHFLAFPRLRIFLLVLVAIASLTLLLNGSRLAGGASAKYKQGLFASSVSQVLGRRQYLYRRAWDITIAHPMGLGGGGFASASTGLNYPHNIFLELGSEYGLPAVGLFTALLVAAWRSRRRVLGGPGSPAAIAAGGFVILLLCEALLSFDINQNRFLFFALGLCFALPRIRPRS